MVKTALSVYLIFMALLVGLYFRGRADHPTATQMSFPSGGSSTTSWPSRLSSHWPPVSCTSAPWRAVDALWTSSCSSAINIAFYSALRLSLWFFWKWFETLFGGGGSDLSWAWIDPLFAIVVGAVGRHIWQSTEDI